MNVFVKILLRVLSVTIGTAYFLSSSAIQLGWLKNLLN